MKYLLDTDHLSLWQSQQQPEFGNIARRLAREVPDDVVVSIVSYHEQLRGSLALINRARTTPAAVMAYERLRNVIEFYRPLLVQPFDATAGGVYDSLVAQRIRIGTMDLRISAIALSRKLIVVTRNTRDFGQVPNLVTEDWSI